MSPVKIYKVKSICFWNDYKKTKLHFHLERSPGSFNVGRRVIYSWWVVLCTKEFKCTELSTSLHVWGACQFTQGFCRCRTAPFPQWKRQILLYLPQDLGNYPEYEELCSWLTKQGATHLKGHVLIESYGAASAENKQSPQKSVLPMHVTGSFHNYIL